MDLYSDSEFSATDSEPEDNNYATLGPATHMRHWLSDYIYGGQDNLRLIDVLYLCLPYLKDDQEDKPIQVSYSVEVGVEHQKFERVFTSKNEKNIAAAFLLVKTVRRKWTESWHSKTMRHVGNQMSNKEGRRFYIHVIGFLGRSRQRAGFAVIVRDCAGTPIYAFHRLALRGDTFSASFQEVEGVYKAVEISEKLNLKNVKIYCTRERLADRINESLCEGTESTDTLKRIQDSKTFFITYCGKFCNSAVRYLARHGKGQGNIEPNKLCGKLVDLLYKDATGETRLPFA